MSSSSLPYLNALTSLRNDTDPKLPEGKGLEDLSPDTAVEILPSSDVEVVNLQVVESAKKAILNRLQSGDLVQEELMHQLKFPKSVIDVQSMIDKALQELQASELVQREDTRIALTPFARQAMGAFLI